MSDSASEEFVDRRKDVSGQSPPGVERRQFVDSHDALPDDVRELAEAIDQYKVTRRRRFVTVAEVLDVVKELGYHK